MPSRDSQSITQCACVCRVKAQRNKKWGPTRPKIRGVHSEFSWKTWEWLSYDNFTIPKSAGISFLVPNSQKLQVSTWYSLQIRKRWIYVYLCKCSKMGNSRLWISPQNKNVRTPLGLTIHLCYGFGELKGARSPTADKPTKATVRLPQRAEMTWFCLFCLPHML